MREEPIGDQEGGGENAPQVVPQCRGGGFERRQAGQFGR